METKEKRPEQADLANHAHGLDRGARGLPGKLILVAFSGYAFMYFIEFLYILLVGKVFIPPVLIEVALVWLAAGVGHHTWAHL